MAKVRRWGWSVILVLAVLDGCASFPQARRDKFLAAGKTFMEKKDYTRAILAFKNAAQVMPKDAEAYYQIGLAALAMGDVHTGALSLKKAGELKSHQHPPAPQHASLQR